MRSMLLNRLLSPPASKVDTEAATPAASSAASLTIEVKGVVQNVRFDDGPLATAVP